MAGKGNTIPKPATQRNRSNHGSSSRTLTVDGELRGPDLPLGPEWPSQTIEWWESWRRSAQAATFVSTDWEFLLDTALLHGQLWAGDASVAGELRLRVSKFGATPEDRLRLRMEIDLEPEEKAELKKPAASRRRDLKVVL
jgi:hypothetical protein